MNFEKIKNNVKTEKTISEIKKAEAEKEVKDTVEKSEIEDIAEVVIDETPVEKVEIDNEEKMSGIESIIENLEINLDAKERKLAKEKLIEYIEKINKYGSDYINPYEYFEPSGFDGRSYNEEIDLFIKKREEDKDYCPVFEYPGIDNLNLEKFNNDKKELTKLKKDIKLEKNENLKIICIDAIVNIENKIGLLESIKDKNYEQAFEYAVKSYGDINDELYNIAEQVYNKNITRKEVGEEKVISEEEQKKIDAREKLKETEFDAEDYKKYFEGLINNSEFKKYGWKVIITSEKNALTVLGTSKEYNHPVILIPKKYNKEKIDGLSFVKNINHEFAHVITQSYNIENGFGGVSFGINYETYTEGLGRLAEKEIEDKLVNLNIINKEKSRLEIEAQPYYVLGMKKVKEGANFAELFDYLVKIKKEELRFKKESNIEEKAIKVAKVFCRRIFRGFDPSEGGNYFPKDKAYLEGEIGAIKIGEEGLINYLYKAKIDPELVPYFIKLGAYAQGSKVENVKKVVLDIIKNKK